DRIGLDGSERATLRRLGVCINYNGYGSSLEDLLFAPADLFERVRPFADPRTFVREDREAFERLTEGYDEDMAKAQAMEPMRVADSGAVFALPDESWARRVSGVWSNDLANASPDRAHAVLTARPDGTWLVSVRAPLSRRSGADALCRRYPTGGGRAAAAGINALPSDQLDAFVEDFLESFAAAE
ncbi:MAG: DHH family phosphoesterase, partial [Planctomycetota bacterium]